MVIHTVTTPVMTRNSSERKSLDESSPGASSSSSPSSVSLPPQQRRPVAAPDNREDLFAALDDDLDYNDSFINDIAFCESAYRELLQDPDQSIQCRKRMRDKTTPMPLCISSKRAESLVLPTVELARHTMPEWQATKKARTKYAVQATKTRDKIKESYRECFEKAYAFWSTLDVEERQKMTEEYRRQSPDDTTTEKVRKRCSNSRPHHKDGDDKEGPQYSPGLLLTWNGSWFLDDEAYVALVQEYIAIPHILVQHVKKYPGIQHLFDDFRKVILQACEHWKIREWSGDMELSLASEDIGRIHFHCFLERNCNEDHAWAMWKHIAHTMKIRGVPVAHSVPACVKSRGKNRCRALTEGHYYCQAEKIGQVLRDSTVPKFVKLFPDSRMVTTMWRHRKMTTSACKAETLASRDKAPSTMSMLDATMALEYSIEQEADAAQADTTWKCCPFKEPNDNELTWVRQYGSLASKPIMRMHRAYLYNSLEDICLALMLRRYKFIIYDGPSRLGKTELACSWFGTLNTLVCNAQDCTTPNLRPMHSGRYSAILFDEGDWRMCYQNKTMMQASPRPVELGQSQCNDRSYQVLLFRVPLIVCSNDFWAGCNNAAAREWIELNSIYVPITEQVWVTAG